LTLMNPTELGMNWWNRWIRRKINRQSHSCRGARRIGANTKNCKKI